ncbi:flavin reductase [Streptomyces sp. NPDC001732]
MSPSSGTDPCVSIEPSVLHFGTPVVLLTTENPDSSVNLAPISSAWALGQVIVLGLGPDGQTARNLTARPELVINIAAPGQWQAVERLAPLTGRHPPDQAQRLSLRKGQVRRGAAEQPPVPRGPPATGRRMPPPVGGTCRAHPAGRLR